MCSWIHRNVFPFFLLDLAAFLFKAIVHEDGRSQVLFYIICPVLSCDFYFGAV